ncbi:MAG: phosphoribosyltransferase family protein [Candidatus Vogelbacteria bacterium]|nr:phosphoribosyltransferase family protein [Candidatus Vogelbacteria bacterium]
MRRDEVKGILEKTGAVLTGHFVGASGKHLRDYVNKDAVYPFAVATSSLCLAIAERFMSDNVEVVIGPEKGGIILAQWVGYHLTVMTGRDVLSIFAEKAKPKPVEIQFGDTLAMVASTEDIFVLKRNYDKLVAGKRVLVVEDVITTSGSIKKVIGSVRGYGGEVVGLGALCNRGGITAEDLDIPRLDALLDVTLESWPDGQCPLCDVHVPINTNVGKGAEYLARQNASDNK